MPGWLWPIIIAGITGFFLYQAIKASELVAHWFGTLGKHINDRANGPARVLAKVEALQESLDMTTAYLIIDAEYHQEADIVIAENCPGVLRLLPSRIPFTEFKHRWKNGWRPASWDVDEG